MKDHITLLIHSKKPNILVLQIAVIVQVEKESMRLGSKGYITKSVTSPVAIKDFVCMYSPVQVPLTKTD